MPVFFQFNTFDSDGTLTPTNQPTVFWLYLFMD